MREAIAGVDATPQSIPARGVKAIDAALNLCRVCRIEPAYAGFGAAVRLEY